MTHRVFVIRQKQSRPAQMIAAGKSWNWVHSSQCSLKSLQMLNWIVWELDRLILGVRNLRGSTIEIFTRRQAHHMQLIYYYGGYELIQGAFLQQFIEQDICLLNCAHNGCSGLCFQGPKLGKMAIVILHTPVHSTSRMSDEHPHWCATLFWAHEEALSDKHTFVFLLYLVWWTHWPQKFCETAFWFVILKIEIIGTLPGLQKHIYGAQLSEGGT